MNKTYFIIILFIVFTSCKNKQPIFRSNLNYINNVNPNDSTLTLKIFNMGESDLIIYNYSSSCDCTIVLLKNNTIIHAKDSIESKIHFNNKTNPNKGTDLLLTLKTNSDTIFKNFHFIY